MGGKECLFKGAFKVSRILSRAIECVTDARTRSWWRFAPFDMSGKPQTYTPTQ